MARHEREAGYADSPQRFEVGLGGSAKEDDGEGSSDRKGDVHQPPTAVRRQWWKFGVKGGVGAFYASSLQGSSRLTCTVCSYFWLAFSTFALNISASLPYSFPFCLSVEIRLTGCFVFPFLFRQPHSDSHPFPLAHQHLCRLSIYHLPRSRFHHFSRACCPLFPLHLSSNPGVPHLPSLHGSLS